MNTFQITDKDKDITSDYMNSVCVNFIGENSRVTIRNPRKIRKIDMTVASNVVIDIQYGLEVNGFMNISATADYTNIAIGNNLTCGQLYISYIDEQKLSLTIGDDCIFGWPVHIRSSDGHTIYDNINKRAINIPTGIKIGNHVWLARNVTILKNGAIPDNCVVGMNALVTKKFEYSNCVIAGIPAKIIKENINWSKLNTEKYMKHNKICTY